MSRRLSGFDDLDFPWSLPQSCGWWGEQTTVSNRPPPPTASWGLGWVGGLRDSRQTQIWYAKQPTDDRRRKDEAWLWRMDLKSRKWIRFLGSWDVGWTEGGCGRDGGAQQDSTFPLLKGNIKRYQSQERVLKWPLVEKWQYQFQSKMLLKGLDQRSWCGLVVNPLWTYSARFINMFIQLIVHICGSGNNDPKSLKITILQQ